MHSIVLAILSPIAFWSASFQEEGTGEFSSIAEGSPIVSVRNNTLDTFQCVFRSGAWQSGVVTFTPARQIDQELVGGANISLQCGAPINNQFINLQPGGRYNFLRQNGQVALFNVQPGQR
jgi:hypothetical protein